MFDKIKNKYDVNEEKNVPEFVYGTPDFMLKNNQNNEDKYNISPEDNMPQMVYGVPDFMKNDNFINENNQVSRYDIQPEDNEPREVYGVPNFMLEERKNQVFEAFVGGYAGPSSFYYINRVINEYEFRYGFSQSGLIISNDPNNKYLHIVRHDEQFYEDFKRNLMHLTEDWLKSGYNDNEILDGTQWNIDIDVKNGIKYSGSNAYPDNFASVMEYIDKAFEVDKYKNDEKYDINPEQNVPQRVYGVPNSEKFVKHKIDLKKVKINIKNNESNYLLMFSYANDKKIDLLFVDLNKLESKTIGDISVNIPKNYYDTFMEKYNSITRDWNERYIGEKNISWSITEETDKKRFITGNGDYPSNWNEFIDLLVEYEILFKELKRTSVDN